MEGQVLSHHVRDVQVDDPVHEVEADEGDGEDDAAILVDVAGSHAEDSFRRWGQRG